MLCIYSNNAIVAQERIHVPCTTYVPVKIPYSHLDLVQAGGQSPNPNLKNTQILRKTSEMLCIYSNNGNMAQEAIHVTCITYISVQNPLLLSRCAMGWGLKSHPKFQKCSNLLKKSEMLCIYSNNVKAGQEPIDVPCTRYRPVQNTTTPI